MEAKVYEDQFVRDFNSAGDFIRFLNERRANSKWTRAPSRELKFTAVEKGTPLGDLFLQLYNAKGEGGLIMDTMDNTQLLMKLNGEGLSGPLLCAENTSRTCPNLRTCPV